jgi:acetyl-CoA carboxylase beta subunit
MKPCTAEDQHIWEIETRQRLEKLESEQQAAAEAEKRRLQELHWMHCPKCGQTLLTQSRSNVEIDVCPSCRGVWLDADELETIVASEGSLLRSALRSFRR